jgi:CRISPR-associated protein Csm2
MEYPNLSLQKKWVQSGTDSDLITWALSFGLFLTTEVNNSKGLTTSQLRRFFGEIRRIEADYDNLKDDIVLINPKLAYAVGRDLDKSGRSKTKIKEFYEEIKSGLLFIRYNTENQEKDFKRLVKVVEAIVAFHKYHGGKES